MAAFAIMRCKKLSGMGSVAASLKHCFRERDTPNADPERLRHNMHMAARSTDEAMGKLREKLPEKRRKDAVLAIEYVLSASPEWWINADSGRKADFYQSSMDWLAEKYGRENILVSSIHLDEKTPHMSAFVVPITKDGRLSAKEFIGNRTKMSNDQSSYAEAVKHLGLVRGIEGSKATHKRIKAHYNALGQQIPVPPEIGEADLKPRSSQGEGLLGKIGLRPMIETPLGVAERLNAKFAKAFKVVAEKASESDSQRGEAVKARMALADTQKRLQALQEPFKGLSKEQVAEVLKQAVAMQQDNQRRQQEQDLARKLEAEIRRKMTPEKGLKPSRGFGR